jgi:AraC-like DNA-binding protein
MNQEHATRIQLVQDYIKEHIKQKITLQKLARVAGYSPSYTESLFYELIGKQLFDYIRHFRLTAAAKQTKDQKHFKVLDLSLDYLFDSHEGFTRAFTKQFGIPPKRYLQNPIPIPYFIDFGVMGRYLYEKQRKESKSMSTQTIFVQVIERPKRKAIIKRGIKADEYFTYCEEVGCDVWGMLQSVPNALYEPVGFWLPPSMRKPNTSEYVQGVEVPESYQGVVPEGFELIDLLPSMVMIFQGEPYEEEAFMDAIGAVWDHIGTFDPKLYGYTFDLSQPRFQMEPRGYRGYIEGRPVKSL